MYQTTKLTHLLLHDFLKNKRDVIAIDATCGAGNDTLFLAAELNHTGHIYAYDLQEIALSKTKTKVESFSNITFCHTSFENINVVFDVCIFNLGYLPGSDKTIKTTAEVTIAAIKNLLLLAKPSFLITLTCYIGHNEGIIEAKHLLDFVKELDRKLFLVTTYQNINQHNAPFIITITNHYSKKFD